MKKLVALGLFTLIFAFGQAQGRFEDEGTETEEQVNETEQKSESTNAKPTQQASKSNFWDRTRFGGNLGLSFGTFTYVNVSPRMYFVATEKLWLGAGLTFIYSKDNRSNLPPTYDPEQFVYGLNLLATYQLIGPVFLQAEYEPLNFERLAYIPGTDIFETERVWVHGLFLGGGISQRVGRGMMFISVLYNVTYTNAEQSYYAQPYVVRIGVGI